MEQQLNLHIFSSFRINGTGTTCKILRLFSISLSILLLIRTWKFCMHLKESSNFLSRMCVLSRHFLFWSALLIPFFFTHKTVTKIGSRNELVVLERINLRNVLLHTLHSLAVRKLWLKNVMLSFSLSLLVVLEVDSVQKIIIGTLRGFTQQVNSKSYVKNHLIIALTQSLWVSSPSMGRARKLVGGLRGTLS